MNIPSQQVLMLLAARRPRVPLQRPQDEAGRFPCLQAAATIPRDLPTSEAVVPERAPSRRDPPPSSAAVKDDGRAARTHVTKRVSDF